MSAMSTPNPTNFTMDYTTTSGLHGQTSYTFAGNRVVNWTEDIREPLIYAVTNGPIEIFPFPNRQPLPLYLPPHLLGPKPNPKNVTDQALPLPWGPNEAPSPPVPGTAQNLEDDVTLKVRVNVFKSSLSQPGGGLLYRSTVDSNMMDNVFVLPDQYVKHIVFVLMAGGKLFLAPVSKPRHVLDITARRGIWVTEMADRFPDTKVVGLTSAYVQFSAKPDNCCLQFISCEGQEDWPHMGKFDLVYGRGLMAFPDPARAIRSASAVLQAGGFLELHEMLFPIRFASPPPADCAIARWADLIAEVARLYGRPLDNAQNYAGWMRDAGLESVVERRFYLPIGVWPSGEYYRVIGSYFEDVARWLVMHLSSKLLPCVGMNPVEINDLMVSIWDELRLGTVHAYFDALVVIGRKPVA